MASFTLGFSFFRFDDQETINYRKIKSEKMRYYNSSLTFLNIDKLNQSKSNILYDNSDKFL